MQGPDPREPDDSPNGKVIFRVACLWVCRTRAFPREIIMSLNDFSVQGPSNYGCILCEGSPSCRVAALPWLVNSLVRC